MGGISLLLVFLCLGAVVYWYAVNEESGSDGDLGLLGLKGAGEAVISVLNKYIPSDRAPRGNAKRLDAVMRAAAADGAPAAPAPRSALYANRAGVGSSYLVKSGGRRSAVRDAREQDVLETAEPGELPPFVDRASYRSSEGARYRRQRGEQPTSRYMRRLAPAR